MTPDEINSICRGIFDRPADDIAYPGGRDRKAVAVRIGETQYVIAKRRSVGRARLEAEVLRRLSPEGGVPALIDLRGDVVVQEYVSGPRLSEVLAACPQDHVDRWLTKGVSSLSAIHSSATASGLDRMVPRIGARAGWCEDLCAAPARLAHALSLDLPVDVTARALPLIAPRAWTFIKWDARPGNAILRADGRLCWIDWEHCGLRRPVDDFAWLLADEWSPDAPKAEAEAARLAGEDGQGAMLGLAILHSCVRLLLIVKRHERSGGWWNAREALKRDRVGVTPDHVRRLCRRAGAWCDRVPEFAGLGEVFARVEAMLIE